MGSNRLIWDFVLSLMVVTILSLGEVIYRIGGNCPL